MDTVLGIRIDGVELYRMEADGSEVYPLGSDAALVLRRLGDCIRAGMEMKKGVSNGTGDLHLARHFGWYLDFKMPKVEEEEAEGGEE